MKVVPRVDLYVVPIFLNHRYGGCQHFLTDVKSACRLLPRRELFGAFATGRGILVTPIGLTDGVMAQPCLSDVKQQRRPPEEIPNGA
jgi:hypothetical protein